MLGATALIAISLWIVRQTIINFADKVRVCFVALGVVWLLFLGISTYDTFQMFRTDAVVTKVENGWADVELRNAHGGTMGYSFPAFDNFTVLHLGETISTLNAGKTTEITARTIVFTTIGFVNAVVLIVGFWNGQRKPKANLGVR